ncbi:MAG TPA: ribosome biogenesis GTPase Der [Clostridiales bacterium]|nr:ribosome biogenesis GTPase Der [Clostridiales bacterium]
MSSGIVAIVGRPNVGKSTLFNRLLRQRKAIVESEPGVTRDRLYGVTDWAGRIFTVVDTGGLDWDGDDPIQVETTRQAEAAIAEADVIIFMVDAVAGLTPADEAAAAVLRKSGKPVIVAANKVDDISRASLAADFHRLGLGEVLPVSALHGLGTGELLDEVVENLPPAAEEEGLGDERGTEADTSAADGPAAVGPIRMAVVGRPNVGKSSLVNGLVGEERVIVADEPGTTRDAVDVAFRRGGVDYVIVDTAGLRKRKRLRGSVERYSVLRTLRAVDRSDVVLLLFDSTRPPAEQDKRMAGYVSEAGRALVLVVNKWDLVETDGAAFADYEGHLRRVFHYVDWAPIVFTSAKTGWNLERVLQTVRRAAENHRRRVPTSEVTRVFRDAVAVNPPPSEGGRRLRVSYVTQASAAPPRFVFFVNSPSLVKDTYRRYLEARAREAWDFTGTPLRLHFRPKGS